MPIYGYICDSCDAEHEVIQKYDAPPLTTCPSCNTENLVKQVSAPSFQLKGTGWYATDFKTQQPKSKNNASEAVTSDAATNSAAATV